MKGQRVRTGLSVLVGAFLVLVACAPVAAPAPAAPGAPKAPAPAAPAAAPQPAPAAGPAPAPAAAPLAPKASSPRYGGQLSYFTFIAVTDLDPHINQSNGNLYTWSGIYSTLLKWDPANPQKINPSLAESWEISPDGKTFVFHLRKDVKWHDGQPFTSADVEATYKRVLELAKNGKSARMGGVIEPLIESYGSPDAYTFRVKLKAPSALYLPVVASAHHVIGAKHLLDKNGNLAKEVTGTGPFTVKKLDPGIAVDWVRNPNYFEKGLPYLDSVRVFILRDDSTQFAALRTGNITIWVGWPNLGALRTKAIQDALGEKVTVHTAPMLQLGMVQPNIMKPPWNDRDVRWALNLILDREEFQKRVYEGDALLGAAMDSRAFPDFTLPYDEVLKAPGMRRPKDRDLAEARRLLDKAGLNYKGYKVTFTVRNTGQFPQEAQVVAKQFNDFGFDAKLEVLDPTAGSAKTERGDYEISIQGTGIPVPSPLMSIFSVYVNKPGAQKQWESPKVQQWYLDAVATLDAARQRELLYNIQKYVLYEDNPNPTLGWQTMQIVYWNKLKGFTPPIGLFDGRAWDRVWLEQ